MDSTRSAAVAAIFLVVGLAIGSVMSPYLSMESSQQAAPAPDSDDGSLSGTVDIGVLLPLTGRLSTHGTENAAGAMLGISDFNGHLEEIGADWSLRGVVEDTATSPAIAADKLTVLNARGINLVIGPETSTAIRNMKGYADSNGMLLLSPSSTASSLAIPGDNVYRMIVDDSNQGPGIAALAEHLDKDVLIPIWRGDAWGDGLFKNSSESFVERGGTVDDGIRYNPETAEFSAAVSLLAEKVEAHTESAGAENVAVLLISFTEAVQIMQSASNYESLSDVRWIGTDANTKEHNLVEDPVASEFSDSVEFTTMQIAATHNDIYEDVRERLGAQFGGRVLNGYAFTSYDAAWVLATAILHAGTTDTEVLKEVLHEVSERNFGAIGTTRLNDAGDLEVANYDLWSTVEGEWEHVGSYILETDRIEILSDDEGAK